MDSFNSCASSLERVESGVGLGVASTAPGTRASSNRTPLDFAAVIMCSHCFSKDGGTQLDLYLSYGLLHAREPSFQRRTWAGDHEMY